MEIAQLTEMADAVYRDEQLQALYAKGDELSKSQTKHDINHALQVKDVAMKLADKYAERFPGRLSEVEHRVVIPLAAYLHDIGRAIDVNDHAVAGARAMQRYLKGKGFPPNIVQRICKVIACHRSSVVLKRNFDDPCWAIVVIADKCVGDEDRVRPWQATKLRVLRFFKACRFWPGSPHDRVNFAIKESDLVVDGREPTESSDAGAIILKLSIDAGVCSPSDIYELYGERFHACGRAAQYLGYLFRLEFNGIRYMYSKDEATWVPVRSIKVLTPSS